jgi:hypothetical protein
LCVAACVSRARGARMCASACRARGACACVQVRVARL